jgi:hypothetical protein
MSTHNYGTDKLTWTAQTLVDAQLPVIGITGISLQT